ncbi:MAG: Lrp/AsnC family transcriptional regulator [Cytophagales bacterium]|nr:Lrp/AsnC family transcriptional regulator [Cytophagales bacterium]
MNILNKLDEKDHEILNILQKDARTTNADLAEKIGLSTASTLERVRKLKKLGIIKSHHTKLDHHKLSLTTSSIVQIRLHSLKKENVAAFKSAIDEISEVIECYQVTGDTDFFLKMVTTDITAYQQLLVEKLSTIEPIKSIRSAIILTTLKENSPLPIPNTMLNAIQEASN